MSKGTLDAATTAALSGTVADTELFSPDGRSVGYFVPPRVYESMRKAFYERAFSDISADDVRRSLANPKRHSMAEVLKLVEGE